MQRHWPAGCVSRPPFWKAVADLNPAAAFSMPPSVRDLPLRKGNDGADVQAIRAALASTVLTKGAGFVFGDLGFFQDEIDRE